jgi:hypothetical protein
VNGKSTGHRHEQSEDLKDARFHFSKSNQISASKTSFLKRFPEGRASARPSFCQANTETSMRRRNRCPPLATHRSPRRAGFEQASGKLKPWPGFPARPSFTFCCERTQLIRSLGNGLTIQTDAFFF